MDLEVTHDKEYQQFTIEMGGDDAELAYATPEQNVLDFQHTYVPESARGKGVANKLIAEGLRYAEENGHCVIASCPAVAKYIERHPEHQKLLKQE
ncbi:GNAT family N-acetyltransferase [Pontibacter vulgaris]|uniref:GNAT family N-acetyltransferase n=1 Tax=Pontibacter vulgaris TaxID=2905679 RepID=UPI001FA811AF|nr:GNAT family N-acetyltransferase [Pontibacter vulgaris]